MFSCVAERFLQYSLAADVFLYRLTELYKSVMDTVVYGVMSFFLKRLNN